MESELSTPSIDPAKSSPVNDSSDRIITLGTRGVLRLIQRHKMAVVSGILSLLLALSGLLIGIGRFEANAQAQGAALAELKTGQQTMQHEVEEKRAADRKELIELLDKISAKQDLANDRIQDLAVELASVKATVRATRHDIAPKER